MSIVRAARSLPLRTHPLEVFGETRLIANCVAHLTLTDRFFDQSHNCLDRYALTALIGCFRGDVLRLGLPGSARHISFEASLSYHSVSFIANTTLRRSLTDFVRGAMLAAIDHTASENTYTTPFASMAVRGSVNPSVKGLHS